MSQGNSQAFHSLLSDLEVDWLQVKGVTVKHLTQVVSDEIEKTLQVAVLMSAGIGERQIKDVVGISSVEYNMVINRLVEVARKWVASDV